MGRSLLALVLSFGISFRSACAESRHMLEPYQVLDIRMEEGVKDVLATRRDLDDSKGKLYSAAFLASQEERGLHRIASIATAQKAESTSLSKMLEQLKRP